MFYHQETTWEYLSTRIQALKLKKIDKYKNLRNST